MTYLRHWALSDARDLAAVINDKQVQDNLRDGLPYPYTAQDATEYIQSVLDAPQDSQYAWAIQIEGKAVGSLGIFRQQNIHRRTAEIGYYLARPHWGSGIMTVAIREACDYIFTHTDILRIFAEPFEENVASCRVLEKAGFCREGILRKNAVKNGRVLDMCMYACIRNRD